MVNIVAFDAPDQPSLQPSLDKSGLYSGLHTGAQTNLSGMSPMLSKNVVMPEELKFKTINLEFSDLQNEPVMFNET